MKRRSRLKATLVRVAQNLRSPAHEPSAGHVAVEDDRPGVPEIDTVPGVIGVWSGQTLRAAMSDLVQPFDPKRVEQTAYALAVGPQVVVTGTHPAMRRDLERDEIFEIPPGQFAYLLTEETITLPPHVLGLLSMKFGQKIRGLINVSGFHVDPGYRGRLLFAVYNAGPQSVMLTRGAPTFLLWITPLDHPTEEPYSSTSVPRTEITAEDIMKIQGEVSTPQALAARVAELERSRELVISTFKTLGKIVVGAIVSLIIGALAVYAWNLASESLGGDDTPPNEQPVETSVPPPVDSGA